MTLTPQSPSQLQQLAQHVLAMPMAKTLGLSFTRIAPGDIEVEIPILDAFSFRPGQLQATPIFAIADFAAIAAAGTVLPLGWLNATVDATIKLMAPATGALLRARGRVVHAGKLQTICAADVYAVSDSGQETLCATLLGAARNLPGETP